MFQKIRLLLALFDLESDCENDPSRDWKNMRQMSILRWLVDE